MGRVKTGLQTVAGHFALIIGWVAVLEAIGQDEVKDIVDNWVTHRCLDNGGQVCVSYIGGRSAMICQSHLYSRYA